MISLMAIDSTQCSNTYENKLKCCKVICLLVGVFNLANSYRNAIKMIEICKIVQ